MAAGKDQLPSCSVCCTTDPQPTEDIDDFLQNRRCLVEVLGQEVGHVGLMKTRLTIDQSPGGGRPEQNKLTKPAGWGVWGASGSGRFAPGVPRMSLTGAPNRRGKRACALLDVFVHAVDNGPHCVPAPATHGLRDFGVRGRVSGEVVPAGVQRPTRGRHFADSQRLAKKKGELRIFFQNPPIKTEKMFLDFIYLFPYPKIKKIVDFVPYQKNHKKPVCQLWAEMMEKSKRAKNKAQFNR